MPEIKTTASYVRTKSAATQKLPEQERLLQLLATPQTVESLSRALSDGPPAEGDRKGVITAMAELYDKGLIEIAPDS
jgi:hypothetical protein